MADVKQQINDETVKVGAVTPTASDNALAVSLSPNSAAISTSHSDVNVSGNITTQNLNPNSGTATTGSTVAATSLNGVATIMVQVTGTYTGALTPQVSIDGVNWVNLSSTGLINTNTNAYSATIASAATGVWQTGASGITQFRISANNAMTGTATVTVRLSAGAGTVALDIPIPAGVNTIGNVIPVKSTTGGLTPFTLISAASTNATSVKASAGAIYGLQASNTGAANAFIKLYNLATAPTVGTSVAAKTLIVPAGGGIVLNAADIGIAFGTGIALAITALATTADTTAVALAQCVINLDYT